MKKRMDMRASSRNDLIFYILGIAIPLIQFCIFYVYLNLDLFATAFREYTFVDGHMQASFVWFKNFKNVFRMFLENENMMDAFWRGLWLYGLGLLRFPFEVLVAYYVARKFPFGRGFQILLFVPGLLSGVVMALTYKYFLCECVPELVRLITGKEILSLLDSGNSTVTFISIWAYGFFVGVTGNILLVGGAIMNVGESVAEAASIDGASETRQFFSIYVPIIFPTLITFIIMGMAGVFLADIGLYPYFGEYAPQEIWTLGYYFTMRTQTASAYIDYPFLSAFSWIITFATIPVVFGGRWILNKINERFE